MSQEYEKLSPTDARNLALHSQNLVEPPKSSSKRELLKIIEKISYVQIDTISIVERSHHHILWTRLPQYSRKTLEELHNKDRKIFEYWSHAAAFLPFKDYRFSLIRKNNYAEKYKDWKKENKKIVSYVYDRIKGEGPLQSRNFEGEGAAGGWWNWKPAKDVLELLFHEGELMVAKRQGFQKVYDLTERVLPGDVNTIIPSMEQYSEHLILNAVRSHGFVNDKEITYQRASNREIIKDVLNKLIERGKIIKVKVGDFADTYYSTKENLKSINKKKSNDSLHILSPFDNLVIQRKRMKALFGYDYQIECYLPEHKRKYGYFCLPILFGDKFEGRMDAKADRSRGTFIVKNIFTENNSKLPEAFIGKFSQKLKELALFSGCQKIEFVSHNKLTKELKKKIF